MSLRTVKALRGFHALVDSKDFRVVKVGQTVNVSETLARELISANKAESVTTPTPTLKVETKNDKDSK